MRSPLRFKKVETPEEMTLVKEFGASFDHVVNEHSRDPIIMVLRDGKLISYFQVIQAPIFAHSLHTDPSVLSPRDFLDLAEQTRAFQFISSLGGRTPHGESLVLAPQSTHMESALRQLGYTDLKQKLWHALG